MLVVVAVAVADQAQLHQDLQDLAVADQETLETELQTEVVVVAVEMELTLPTAPAQVLAALADT